MATEQFGDIVIAPRVLEKIIAIATAKVAVSYTHLTLPTILRV